MNVFSAGVPREIVGNFDYYHPIVGTVPSQHPDFINETVIRISTCGVTGRYGPTVENCTEKYNDTNIEMYVPPSTQDQEEKSAFNLEGVQRWTAPRGEYYTLVDAI